MPAPWPGPAQQPGAWTELCGRRPCDSGKALPQPSRPHLPAVGQICPSHPTATCRLHAGTLAQRRREPRALQGVPMFDYRRVASHHPKWSLRVGGHLTLHPSTCPTDKAPTVHPVLSREPLGRREKKRAHAPGSHLPGQAESRQGAWRWGGGRWSPDRAGRDTGSGAGDGGRGLTAGGGPTTSPDCFLCIHGQDRRAGFRHCEHFTAHFVYRPSIKIKN